MNEILINITTAGIQHQPVVAPLRSSHVLVAWVDRSDLTIKGRLLQADGDPSSGEFPVNTPTPSGSNIDRQRPAIASSGSGPIVAWIEQAVNPPGPRPHVKMRRFGADGEAAGVEIQVSATDVDPAAPPAVTGMIDGGFLVTWLDARADRRILARRFGPDGSPRGDAFQVNSSEGFHLDPVAIRLADGNVVLAWRSDPSPPGGGALTFRIFDLEGAPVTDEIVPNLSGFTGQKALTLLDNGHFVIAHVRSLGVSDIGVAQSAVHANVFTADGASANIPIFATDGTDFNRSAPSLAPLPNGRFLLAWVEKRADTVATTPSVRARIFSGARGEALGNEVEANTTTTGARSAVSAATLFGGGDGEAAFLAWADDSETGGDLSNSAVRGRLLPINGSGGFS